MNNFTSIIVESKDGSLRKPEFTENNGEIPKPIGKSRLEREYFSEQAPLLKKNIINNIR